MSSGNPYHDEHGRFSAGSASGHKEQAVAHAVNAEKAANAVKTIAKGTRDKQKAKQLAQKAADHDAKAQHHAHQAAIHAMKSGSSADHDHANTAHEAARRSHEANHEAGHWLHSVLGENALHEAAKVVETVNPVEEGRK